MKKLKYDVIIAAAHSLPVFINGALGTEKEVLAKYFMKTTQTAMVSLLVYFVARTILSKLNVDCLVTQLKFFMVNPMIVLKGFPLLKRQSLALYILRMSKNYQLFHNHCY